jgi:hypothetical protein
MAELLILAGSRARARGGVAKLELPDRGTSKTGPSGREGGFEDGGLGASCFARGVAAAATARPPALSAK